MISTRIFEPKDYDVIAPWYTAHGWPQAPHISMLPEGTGIIVEDENGPIAAGFLYVTNSPIAFFEWLVTKPGIGMQVKSIFMRMFDALKIMSDDLKIAKIMHMTNPKFSQFLQKCIGFDYSETVELLFLNMEKGAKWQHSQQ